jgi:hypothetical protein
VPLHDFLHVMVVMPDGLGRREIDWAKDVGSLRVILGVV